MHPDADRYYSDAAKTTIDWMKEKLGGPFGATLVRGDDVIVTVGNRQLGDIDPTQHAEIVAIREACTILGTRDLSDCVIYATCEPCPMCVGAIIWAGIKTCYFAATRDDADKHGFGDGHLRDYLAGRDDSVVNLVHTGNREDCDALFPRFWELNAEIVDGRDSEPVIA
ncbi:hypothetical protein GCM10027053_16220 [Intrasporangium mesophilum]